jgi:hypothetical protein
LLHGVSARQQNCHRSGLAGADAALVRRSSFTVYPSTCRVLRARSVRCQPITFGSWESLTVYAFELAKPFGLRASGVHGSC